MTWPDRVTVLHKLRSRPSLDTDSVTLDVVILSEAQQRPAARCEEDIVVYDYRAGKKAALLPFMVDRFGEVFEEQEAAKREFGHKANRLLQKVKDLERETWDREGATEDLGSART